MKKLLLILTAAIFTSCSCVLSQLPPQTIYVDANCQGQLPDYTLIVTATDNCGTVALAQTPAPYTILTVNQPVVEVTIIGTDQFGNSSQISFQAMLIDTVAPILEWPIGQVAMGAEGTSYLWENLLAKVDADIAHFMYDMSWTQGMPLADTTQIMENLHWFTFSKRLSDEQLAEYTTYMDSQR